VIAALLVSRHIIGLEIKPTVNVFSSHSAYSWMRKQIIKTKSLKNAIVDFLANKNPNYISDLLLRMLNEVRIFEALVFNLTRILPTRNSIHITWSGTSWCSAAFGRHLVAVIVTSLLSSRYVDRTADYSVDVASWSCHAGPHVYAGVNIKQFYENTSALLKPLSCVNSMQHDVAAAKWELLSAWEVGNTVRHAECRMCTLQVVEWHKQRESERVHACTSWLPLFPQFAGLSPSPTSHYIRNTHYNRRWPQWEPYFVSTTTLLSIGQLPH